MAHFAKVYGGIVHQVIVVDNEDVKDNEGEKESIGIAFCKNLFGDRKGITWVQTSYNHNIRKQFASLTYSYDLAKNIFIAPQPFPSFKLDAQNDWVAPKPYPGTDEAPYYNWNEEILDWEVR